MNFKPFFNLLTQNEKEKYASNIQKQNCTYYLVPNLVKDPHLGQAFNLGKSTDCNIGKNIKKIGTAIIYSTTVKNKENDRGNIPCQDNTYAEGQVRKEGYKTVSDRQTLNSHEDKRE